LADAGYSLTGNFLTPFRGVRYHLKEWSLGQNRPQNKEELFNLRHSSLRNVIERIFGVLKKRFPILTSMPPYSIEMQRDIIYCCFFLHNFIRAHQHYCDSFDSENINCFADSDVEMSAQATKENVVNGDSNFGKLLRERIATDMWESYQGNLLQRRLLN
jgi:hypothetical protein